MLTELITDVVKDAFAQCNYSPEYGLVTLSNRPDLCQFQCNGSLVAAKDYKMAPITIAIEITNFLKVGLAALKYSDLSNQISKDYMFDVDRFTSSEGNTGPYIIYTIVRIKSILNKVFTMNPEYRAKAVFMQLPYSESERNLMLKITQLNEVIINSFVDYSPHKICQFIYELSNEFNRFYHENKIISERDSIKQNSWLKLITLSRDILVTCLDLLGIEVPDRM